MTAITQNEQTIIEYIDEAFGGTVTTAQQVYLLLGKFNLKGIDPQDLGISSDLLKTALALVIKHNPNTNKLVSFDDLYLPDDYKQVYTALLIYSDYAKQIAQAEDNLLEAVGVNGSLLEDIINILK